MSMLAVAAMSARMLVETARADGFEVMALDLFGDADTRRASAEWFQIGRSGSLHLDSALFLSALEQVAQRGIVKGWIAGSGFEGQPELIERGAALLPLIGTPAPAVRRVRDPQTFFGFLDAEGIPHPEVRLTAPADPAGWLSKDASGCGGWHIRRVASQHGEPPLEAAGDGAHSPSSPRDQGYFQREMPGAPMSATFIANGSDAIVLGFNQLIARRFGARPFVFCGVVGPLPLPDDVAQRITAAVRALAAEFSLRGLGSLDFMLDGETLGVLEVNPRPPASIALYSPRFSQGLQAPVGLVAAHVRACLEGELTSWTLQRARNALTDTVQGVEIVFATRPIHLDELAAQRLAARADCHDLPAAAARFESGDPICSVSASGANAEQVRALLARGRKAVIQSLETAP